MQRYLIYHNGTAFFTQYFWIENNFMPGVVVFDLMKGLFCNDGKTWIDITEDHL